jgi:hypothetical protein
MYHHNWMVWLKLVLVCQRKPFPSFFNFLRSFIVPVFPYMDSQVKRKDACCHEIRRLGATMPENAGEVAVSWPIPQIHNSQSKIDTLFAKAQSNALNFKKRSSYYLSFPFCVLLSSFIDCIYLCFISVTIAAKQLDPKILRQSPWDRVADKPIHEAKWATARDHVNILKIFREIREKRASLLETKTQHADALAELERVCCQILTSDGLSVHVGFVTNDVAHRNWNNQHLKPGTLRKHGSLNLLPSKSTLIYLSLSQLSCVVSLTTFQESNQSTSKTQSFECNIPFLITH